MKSKQEEKAKMKKAEKKFKVTAAHIAKILKSGRWMLRRSNNGKSHKGFQWAPVGEWTVAPDWNGTKECVGGLHGNGPNTSAEHSWWSDGCRLDFCEVGPDWVYCRDKDDKIKCKTARILLVNEIPKGLKHFEGNLDLKGCEGVTSLGGLLSVGGYLDLEGCTGITQLPEHLSVGGSLDLRGTGITQLPEHLSVGGYLDLRGSGVKELPKGLKVEGNIYRD